MNEATKIAGLVVLLVAGFVFAGIPPSESGLTAPNDSQTKPRRLAITDGGALVTNVDLQTGPRNPAQFNIPNDQGGAAALTVQCPDAGAWIYTDVTTCGPGLGMMVPAGSTYTTACRNTTRVKQNDGGMYVGCVVCESPLAGETATECFVHALRGTFP